MRGIDYNEDDQNGIDGNGTEYIRIGNGSYCNGR